MYLRQTEYYIHLCVTAERHKFTGNRRVVKVFKTGAGKFAFCFYPRRFLQVVVAAQVVFA